MLVAHLLKRKLIIDMTLIANPPIKNTANHYEMETEESNNHPRDLKIITSKSYTDKSQMHLQLKEKLRRTAPDMVELFKRIAELRGEKISEADIRGNVLTASNLSAMTLHVFALEAAKYGKTVAYKEEKTITITD